MEGKNLKHFPGHLCNKKFVHVLGLDDEINRFMMKNMRCGLDLTFKMHELWVKSFSIGEQRFFNPRDDSSQNLNAEPK